MKIGSNLEDPTPDKLEDSINFKLSALQSPTRIPGRAGSAEGDNCGRNRRFINGKKSDPGVAPPLQIRPVPLR
jgi:hypothetical protein